MEISYDKTGGPKLPTLPPGYTKSVRAADERGSNPPIRNYRPKIGRNAKCPCGSGKKFKVCLRSHES